MLEMLRDIAREQRASNASISSAPSSTPTGIQSAPERLARSVDMSASDLTLRRAGRLLRILLTGGALIFVVLAARSLATRWGSQKVEISVVPLLLSMLPLVFGAWVLAWGWKHLLERMAGRKIPTAIAVALQIESQLARYMPGKVGVPLIRMAGASRLGTTARLIGVSVLVETVSLLAIGGSAAIAALLGSSWFAQGVSPLGDWGKWVLCGFGLGTLLLLLVDRRHVPRLLLRLMDDGGHGPLVPPGLPFAHVFYWGSWLIHGYLVSTAVGANASAATASSGFYVLAPILGFFALVTPAGLGVREAVLAMGLAPVLGAAPALAAAIASRGISLMADVAAWLLSRPLARVATRTG
jgi:hypothetical protein